MRERGRFLVNELRDIPTVCQYQLRGSALRIRVRHPLLDMWVLEEIFRFRVYEPPAEVTLALGSLNRPIRVVDLGGHVGFFGLFMLPRFPGATIVSFEPDPRNAEVLRGCVELNSLGDRWRVIESSAATRDGTAEFASSFHLSRIGASDERLERLQRGIGGTFSFLRDTPLLTAERHRVECRDVFPYLADADLVKIDIEGSEWGILADPRLGEVPASAVVLEYHPGYVEDADTTARSALAEAGYRVGRSRRTGDAAMLWAWRPQPPIS